ncbi:MAG: hypothetical protein LUD68_04315 [Rikenellaceae bacterium]|nr:hypothetical protein [Rikenellaceae bacterium]
MIPYLKLSIGLSALLLTATGLKAQPVASAGMPADARSAGFAGASVAMDAHPMSLYTNMAAAAFADPRTGNTASYGFSALGNDTYLHALAAQYRLDEKHTFGLGARYFRADPIHNTADGIEYTAVRPYDLLIDAAYARRIHRYLALSVNPVRTHQAQRRQRF